MTNLQKKRLRELLIETLGNVGEIDINEAARRMRGVRGFYSEEGYAKAAEKYEVAFTSAAVRSLKTEEGGQLFLNISFTDEKGEERHVYKQLPLLTLEEKTDAGAYRVKMAARHLRVLRQIAAECKSQHKTKLPVQLSLLEDEMNSLRPLLSNKTPAKRAERPQPSKERTRERQQRLSDEI